MADRRVLGYPVGQVVMAGIVLASVAFTFVLVTFEEETVFYAGVAIGVGLVLFAGLVSYVAARRAPTE